MGLRRIYTDEECTKFYNKRYKRAVLSAKKKKQEFLAMLPKNLKEYHERYKGELPNFELMIKGQATQRDNSQLTAKKRYRNKEIVYDFRRYDPDYVKPKSWVVNRQILREGKSVAF